MYQQKFLQKLIGLMFTMLLVACGSFEAASTSIPPTPTLTPIPPTLTPTPVPKPKAGQWKGDGVSFTVTEDNQLRDLQVRGAETFGTQSCWFEINIDLPISDSEFEFLLPTVTTGENGDSTEKQALTGEFTSETTAKVSYSYKFCPNPASVSTMLQQGTRTATWQGQ